MGHAESTYLHTLGHPVLRRRGGTVVEGLRRKDLALLAYLCVEGDRPFSRSHLAALLWGESAEDRARHSLTQALRRASAGVGRHALTMERDTVRWTGAAACDAQLLLEGDARLDELLSIYEGPFLEGFEAGFGSDEFSAWADARRAELRRAAVRWLDRAGERAEREKDWPRAQRIGERSVQIDRVSEVGHRRVMRALLERGERNLALRHYREFAHWLIHEVGGLPDPETTALADVIRAGAPAIDPPPAPPAAEGDAMAETTRIPAGPEGPAKGDAAPPPPAAGWGTADSIRGGDVPQNVSTPGATPLESPPAAPAGIAPGPGGRRRGVRTAVVAPLLVAAIGAAVWLAGSRSAGEVDTHASFGRGEVIRAEGDATAYLSFGDTLYGFPDEATLKRCLGGWPRVRLVRALPPHPRRTLPSVRTQPWLGGEAAVRSEVPPATQYVVVGCVLSPIPDPPTFREIFGHGDWNRSRSPGDRLLRRLPSIELAYAFPLRPAGALIQGPGDSIRWVTYHGGALAVRDTTVLATYCRTRDEVVRVPDPEFRYYQGHADLPPASAPCGAAERRTLD